MCASVNVTTVCCAFSVHTLHLCVCISRIHTHRVFHMSHIYVVKKLDREEMTD